MDEILQKLQIFGYEKYSKAILTALVTGEPILFIGRHGSGKTLLAERLAQAMGYKTDGNDKEFNAYDASKSVFEDIIGFPNPQMMKKGLIDYLRSPITLWDKKFILIDEISRANPSMQSKWLEVIKNRSLMGQKIPELKYVFSAMNPMNYPGANPLDPALADRFSIIVQLEDSLKEEDVKKIVSVNNESSSLLKGNENLEFNGELNNLVEKITGIYKKLPKSLETLAKDFCVAYYRNSHFVCSEKEFKPVSERRVGMMFRNLGVMLSIDIEKKIRMTKKNLTENLTEVSKFSWIVPAIEETDGRNYETEIMARTMADIGLSEMDEEGIDYTQRIIDQFKNSVEGEKRLKNALTILKKAADYQEKEVLPKDGEIEVIKKAGEIISSVDSPWLNRRVKGLDIQSFRMTGLIDTYFEKDDAKFIELLSEVHQKEEKNENRCLQEKKTA